MAGVSRVALPDKLEGTGTPQTGGNDMALPLTDDLARALREFLVYVPKPPKGEAGFDDFEAAERALDRFRLRREPIDADWLERIGFVKDTFNYREHYRLNGFYMYLDVRWIRDDIWVLVRMDDFVLRTRGDLLGIIETWFGGFEGYLKGEEW